NRVGWAVSSAITNLGFTRKAKSNDATFKHFDTIRGSICEKVIESIESFDQTELPPPTPGELQPRIKDALKEWERHQIARVRWETKTQRVYPATPPNKEQYSSILERTGEWSNEQAAKIMVDSLLPALTDKYGQQMKR
ncbi:MAG: hypothetical protein GWO20_04070, partial [Candidatus Korarchaeota archaeon]|nr:hypothetical protein [Candidatus Korarchaeota archaeon]NIU83217.1 hypothetical protein [Candidatus Thorarchaeota archaeon]NIW13581.1 hypothetical protein [Candidatus Thorarchaeota archaeon]NIW51690.1 hypothetical protein [Candidatus Korarchaeota archaeon]